jgi:hypothetical protein
VTEPADLLAVAREKVRRGEGAHWFEQAELLAQIEDEGLWMAAKMEGSGYNYVSFTQWALGDLNLSPGRLTEYRKAYALVRQCFPVVQHEEWAKVGGSTLRNLRRVLAVGADLREWFDKAVAMTPTEYAREVDLRLGREKWIRWSVVVTADAYLALDAALVRVLPDVAHVPNPDPASITDRGVRFQCALKVAEFVQAAYVAGREEGDPEGKPGDDVKCRPPEIHVFLTPDGICACGEAGIAVR